MMITTTIRIPLPTHQISAKQQKFGCTETPGMNVILFILNQNSE